MLLNHSCSRYSEGLRLLCRFIHILGRPGGASLCPGGEPDPVASLCPGGEPDPVAVLLCGSWW